MLKARRKSQKLRAFHLLVLPETIWNIYLILLSKSTKTPNSTVIAAKLPARSARYCSDMDLKDSVQRAVDECIKDGILADFLRMNKAEVIAMSIFEYDEKEVLDYIREEERTIGRAEGRTEGRTEEAQKYGRLILHLTNEGKSDLIVKIAADDALRESLYQEYQL